ncbi:MAG TPA: 7-cyano-7-deazaguanine synthase [Solirubrobacteraceae bacterium]
MNACVLLSGGFDSATALASLRSNSVSTSTVFVDYGQPARHEEQQAAARLARHYGVAHHELGVSGLRIGDGEIQGRNAILATLAIAAAPRAGTITLGIHAGSSYWDCSGDFLALVQALADGYTGGTLQVMAPLLDFSKTDVYTLGRGLGVPENLTYSCELGGTPCGRCASCRDQVTHARA